MKERPTGIVLILVSGLLTVLGLLVTVFVRASGFSAAADGARLAQIGARLVAESGMSYAAGRLGAEDGYPLPVGQAASRENRGDDWTFRDGLHAGLDGAVNVSYGHGECWTDDGDGLFDPGETPGPDLNGDGRFSAWSGRVRGGEGPFGSVFALRVVSTGALCPINAGGVNALCVRLLDNLGAILFSDGEVPERVDRSYTSGSKTGEDIRISALGRHLLVEDLDGDGILDPGEDANGDGSLGSAMPFANGRYAYTSLDQVRARLASDGYGTAQIEKVIPYLDLGPYEGVSLGNGTASIELSSASPEVLAAIWTYASFMPSGQLKFLNGGAGIGLGMKYGVSGVRAGETVSYAGAVDASIMIYPDEAARLAQWAAEFRATSGRSSWLSFRKSLCERARPDTAHPAGPLFQDDIAPLVAGGFVDAAYGWSRAKADAAFFAVYSQSAGTFGIDPGPGLPPGGIARPFVGVGTLSDFRFPFPAASGAWPASPYKEKLKIPSETSYFPNLTLAPPTMFRVEALARVGKGRFSASGKLRAAERLEFTSQGEFENFAPVASLLTSRGISAVEPPNKNDRRRKFADTVPSLVDLSGDKPVPAPFRGAVTGPSFNPSGFGFPPSEGLGGFVALAGKYTWHQGAYLYWPIRPDDLPRPEDPAAEVELRTDSRRDYFLPAAPDPVVYRTLYHTNGEGVNSVNQIVNPWIYGISNNREDFCWPFDFPPLTNGSEADGMRPFSIELWTGGGGEVFRLTGNAVEPNGFDIYTNPPPAAPGPPDGKDDNKENDIEIILHRQAVEGGVQYTATFKAPASSNVTVRDDAPGIPLPPPESAYHYGGYWLDAVAFVPDIDLGDLGNPLDDRILTGTDHVVLTLENLETVEDTDGDGAVDPWEDWNGNGTVAGEPRNELTLTLYVNGKLVAVAKDGEELRENIRRAQWMTRGRTYPSFPYPMSEATPLARMTCFSFLGDEVKLYDDTIVRASGVTDLDGDGNADKVLKEQDVLERYRLGRFYLPPAAYGGPGSDRNPEFLSPMYVFSRPVTVKAAGWLGIPASDPSGAERVGMVPKVGIPKTGPLRVEGPVLRPTEQLTSRGDFSSLGRTDRLGYSVEFENLDPSNTEPLYATPFFEGVWIQVQGNGRSPAWVEPD